MNNSKYCIGFVLISLFAPSTLAGNRQQPTPQEEKHQHNAHRVEGMNERGDRAMGFSHDKTTHHFRLTTDGGVIEVTANDMSDVASVEQIRSHLNHIAK